MRQEVAKGLPLVRREVMQRGLRGNTLSEMAAQGTLYRVARGVYAPKTGTASSYFDYELASRVVPKGVFTLLSALRLHGLTDENPTRMTMAIPMKSHASKSVLPIDFVYMKNELLESDVVEIKTDNDGALRAFSVERTLAECFKARNKIGVGVAVSALHEAVSKGLVNFSRLGDALKRCRMLRIAQPYLEGLS